DAAIKHLLKRFEPAELEARMSRPGGLGGLFGASRQAQYWQQFTELYSKISQEAEDDFQDLFGREFSRAYEEQSARLRAALAALLLISCSKDGQPPESAAVVGAVEEASMSLDFQASSMLNPGPTGQPAPVRV
nr:hypothetical protein [Tanacetum cinerariifolium]